jgi:hypothetical protein
MKDLENYLQLQKELIKHLWDIKGQDGREEWLGSYFIYL